MKKINLRLFAEGGDGGNANTNGSAEGNQNLLNVGSSNTTTQKVVYGKQEADIKNQNPTATPDRKAEFEKLISGEYKDLFTQRTQDIIDKRFKQTKQLETYKSDTDPILAMLHTKYGTTDTQGLRKAIEDDTSYWETMADREGLSVEQYKTKVKLENENAQFRQMLQNQERERNARAQVDQWMQDAQTVQADYPDFDLKKECANPHFIDLLSKGIDMKTAYEVINMDSIKNSVSRKAEQAVSNSVRANGLRPSENGISAGGGIITKADPSKLTKDDRKEIAKRVARGEAIKF